MKKGKLIIAGVALALGLALAGCTGVTEELGTKVDALDLTVLLRRPVPGEPKVTIIEEAEQYSGKVSWNVQGYGEDWEAFDGEVFDAQTIYQAVAILTPTKTFTFSGISENTFMHDDADSVTNAPNQGVATITFPATAAAEQYSVTYNANGGSGTPPAVQSIYAGKKAAAASASSLSKAGSVFTEWNTDPTGAGEAYAPGEKFTVTGNITLYAQWADAAETFTITYDANGGEGTPPEAETACAGDRVTVQSASGLSKAGSAFTCWNTAADGSGGIYNAGAVLVVRGNVTLYAQWTSAEAVFTITFDANGGTGTPPAAVQAKAGEKVTVPAGDGLSRTGYVFAGWNTQAGGGGAAYSPGEEYTVTGNAALYAQWADAAVEYKVKYDANGGTGTPPADKTVAGGASYIVENGDGISRAGYRFAAWNTLGNGAGTDYAPGSSFTVTENVTLYARWEALAFTVTYNANGGIGTPPAPASVFGGGTHTVQAASGLSREGYTFTAWNTEAGGGGTAYAVGASLVVTANITLYAQWSGATFTVTYNANGGVGTPPAPASVVWGGSHTVQAASGLSREGYSFTGWNTAIAGAGLAYQPGDSFLVTGDITLYAQWATATFTVTYDANGGTGTPPPSASVSLGGIITVSNAEGLSRESYTFIGWNTGIAGAGLAYQPGDTLQVTSNITLYAQWALASYTITYNANGGSGTPPASATVTGGGTYTVRAASGLSREGYTFTGWNTAAGGGGTAYAVGSILTVTANITLYAQWATATFTVTYSANGGSGTPPAAAVVAQGGTHIVQAASGLSLAGCVFKGWNTAAAGNGTAYAEGASITVTADITLYAQWTAISYTVTYSANGGSGTPPATATVTGGETHTVQDAGGLSRTGYIFAGWNTSAGGSGTAYAPGASITVTANITLYAQWTASEASYKILFAQNGGSGVSSITYTPADIPITLPAPSRAGYSFVAWYENNTFTGNTVAVITMSNLGNKTLYAKWITAAYSITYVLNGGSGPTSGGYDASAGDVLLSTPTKAGYAFAGWYTTISLTGTPVTAVPQGSSGNKIYYAKWSIITYTITYNLNGGDGAVNATYTVESGVITLPIPVRPGYIFGGWYRTSSLTGASTSALPQGTTGDQIFYAKWTL